jgi:O-antigen/teichoic acid export membrane protein
MLSGMNAVRRSQAVLASAHAGRLLLSLAIASLLGRNLPPADFAFVALVSTLYVVAVEFLDMGTTAVANREIAAHPEREREMLAALLALRRLLGVAAFAMVLALACSDYVVQDDQRLALVVAACGIFLLHFHAYQIAFQVRQAYGAVTSLAVSSQLGFLIACAAVLPWKAGGAAIALLVVAREAVLALGIRVMAARTLGHRLRAHWLQPGAAALLKAGWMIGVAGLAYKLTTYSGVFILWESPAPVALASFNAAQRLLVPMADLAWMFVTPLIAAMSAAAARDPREFRLLLEGHLKFLLGVSSMVAVTGYFVAPFVLRLLYGEMYVAGPASAVEPFRWLAFGYLFAMVSPVLIVGEIVRGNARALMFITTVCLALNLAGNAWAIPRYGAQGAAMVLCLSEALVFLVLFARMRASLRVGA